MSRYRKILVLVVICAASAVACLVSVVYLVPRPKITIHLQPAFLFEDATRGWRIQVMPAYLVRDQGIAATRLILQQYADASPRFAFDGGNRFAQIAQGGHVDNFGNPQDVVLLSKVGAQPEVFAQQVLGDSGYTFERVRFNGNEVLLEIKSKKDGTLQSISIPWTENTDPRASILRLPKPPER